MVIVNDISISEYYSCDTSLGRRKGIYKPFIKIDTLVEPKAIYDKNNLIGYVDIFYNSKEKIGYINKIMTDIEYQKEEYVLKIINELIKILRNNEGIKKIQTIIEPDNLVARSMYDYVGFIEVDESFDGKKIAIMKI